MKILIVEDEPSLRGLMSDTLSREGYLVETASDFPTAEEKVHLYRYDCILLDINLPGGCGLDILRTLKDGDRTDPVIIISARDTLDDRIEGLEKGADDYLTKPFHLAELSARIRSVCRRARNSGRKGITLGNVTLLEEENTVTVDGVPLGLVRKEFDILSYFMQRPGYVVDKVQLSEAVWGESADMADKYDFIYGQIKNLRRKMAQGGATVEIKSIYGFGYKLVELG